MMALFEYCITPGSVTVPGKTGSKFGYLAEATIELFYLTKHRKMKLFFPLSTTDFSDLFGGVSRYIDFLILNNPSLVIKGPSLRTGIKVPDLHTDDKSLKEYYEVKPNSPSGLVAGATKIAALVAYFSKHRLTYVPGVRWTPAERVLLYKGMMYGFSVSVVFKFWRTAAGLIVYHVCVECDFELEQLVIEAIVAAVVLMIVFGPEILAAAAGAIVLAGEEAAAAAALAAAWAAALRSVPVFSQ